MGRPRPLHCWEGVLWAGDGRGGGEAVTHLFLCHRGPVCLFLGLGEAGCRGGVPGQGCWEAQGEAAGSSGDAAAAGALSLYPSLAGRERRHAVPGRGPGAVSGTLCHGCVTCPPWHLILAASFPGASEHLLLVEDCPWQR